MNASKQDLSSVFPGAMRFIRDLRGLSVDELASRMGASASEIALLESGSVSPTLKTVERIAEALQVAPATLVVGKAVDELKALVRQPVR